MKAQKHFDGKITIFDTGINIEITPQWLIKETMNKESLKILSTLIENELIASLKTFKDSYENTIENRKKIYDKTIISELIKRIALIERDLVNKLHFDGECIELDEELQEIRDYAFSVWKYCTEYGFVNMKEVELK